MKKVLTSAIIAFMAVSISLYAQEKDTTQGAPLSKQTGEVDLQVIYEKMFDDTIADVFFDTTTVSIEEAQKMGWKEEAFKGMKVSDKTRIIYPKVVITRKKRKVRLIIIMWVSTEVTAQKI